MNIDSLYQSRLRDVMATTNHRALSYIPRRTAVLSTVLEKLFCLPMTSMLKI